MVMMLRQCCCGCTLKTGTIIIGILNIIGAAYSFISGIVVAAATDVVDSTTVPGYSPQEIRSLIDTLQGVSIAIIVISAILFIVAVCLTAGAVYENPVLLVPWLVYTCLYMIVNLILYIVIGAMYASAGLAAQAAGEFIVGILYCLLETYFLLVVYSLFRELKGTAPSPA